MSPSSYPRGSERSTYGRTGERFRGSWDRRLERYAGRGSGDAAPILPGLAWGLTLPGLARVRTRSAGPGGEEPGSRVRVPDGSRPGCWAAARLGPRTRADGGPVTKVNLFYNGRSSTGKCHWVVKYISPQQNRQTVFRAVCRFSVVLAAWRRPGWPSPWPTG